MWDFIFEAVGVNLVCLILLTALCMAFGLVEISISADVQRK